MAQKMTIEQIKQLIFRKEDEMRRLCFHKNSSLATERWYDYQAELQQLRQMAANL